MISPFNQNFKKDQGFTLIEMLVAMTISSVLLGATIMVFNQQRDTITNESTKTNLRSLGRVAMAELSKEIRRAGYGFPPGQAAGITAATSTSLTFNADSDNVVTTLNTTVAAGESSLIVNQVNNNGTLADPAFTAGDNIVVFNIGDFTVWETLAIQSISGTTLSLTGTTANAYDAEDKILIHKYHTFSYVHDSVNNVINQTFDGGANIPVVGNVNSLTFTYFDANDAALTSPLSAADRANIRKAQIDLVLQDPDNSDVSVTFKTDIFFRNMATKA